MENNVVVVVICFVLLSFILVLMFSRAVFVGELTIREFYYPLRVKYPNSYVRQNKVTKFVRKCTKLKDSRSIHWTIYAIHHIQLLFVILPFTLLPILLIFLSTQEAISWYAVVGFWIPGGLFLALNMIHLFSQCSKCKKIKKTDPRYSKRDFNQRNG